MRMYYEFQCPNPECEQISLVDNGDVSDLTVGDVEYVDCCYCNRVSQVPECEGEAFILLPPNRTEGALSIKLCQ